MKKITAMLLTLAMVAGMLSGCAGVPFAKKARQQQVTFFDLFDTVTTIVGYADTEEDFYEITDLIYEDLKVYHQLFDIYHDYEGVSNIKTINDQAGIAPVKVEQKLIAFLKDCRTYYELSGGAVNAAMGSVLQLWHEERTRGNNDPENAKLPDAEELKAASEHCSFDTVIIDEEASTVYLEDPKQQLDVGAIAKGWAAEQVCENAPSGLLISVGGNVKATGPKMESGSPWIVGIQSPDGENGKYLHTVYVNRESVVTSGDYQRYYTVDGKQYHHIIDPDTLYPAQKWKAVTIVCEDSGLGDALSTTLFLLSKEDGQKLLDKMNACAVWVDLDGEVFYSDGFEKIIKN